ncbi:2-hydroxychromene-2-carboxylate isomerase/DsbA-like thioredoxin domain [Leucobacter sp. 7(1)]|uniref:DsbA family oxidoreductase n=1 Tax=Leucobacter sp. 7(1) TaxID=1255613 RepID=UPI00097F56D5|nr:DsbA family oxidoreductase [Leucobacter sp. 7(1)]SJN10782.1 2-hydroxychromene-2-carboxylate isomerase/DsbA-like thioredoxin domain [Leucobacter sp. 7(1)]
MTAPITVDVWSDIACPFCYIGKRKLEAAVTSTGIPVEITYHSFELDPEATDEAPGAHAEKLAKKMGVSREQAEAMGRRVVDSAAEVGVTMDYSRVQGTRTRTAHQLLHYAKQRGRQAEMKERLMSAYFTDGVHVGNIDALADLAAEIGLDRADVVRSLTADEYLAAVEADVQQAQSYGIQGVPFFVLDGKYAISGAQEPETFARALTQVRDERVSA